MPNPPPKIVTRFAPSPTGYLHIGGARTALFNWAFARKHGGTFILRIEDTDKARSTPEATRRIIEDLTWLGIDWDEGPDPSAADVYDPASRKGSHGPYFQSQREHLYRQYLDRLIAAGRVYEENGACRFKMPGTPITVHDLVLGDVTIEAAQLEDFIIMKGATAGGGPTFHFANVVDDAEMGVTHVLRAQEHLMNTPKHVALFDALGIPQPKYAHMPLIFNPDGSKMSKRDKAKAARNAATGAAAKAQGWPSLGFAAEQVRAFLDKKSDDAQLAAAIAGHLNITLPEIDIHDFRKSGYLPGVILNYIALLGWSPKHDIERFDLGFLVANFDCAGIGKSNAKFDRAKLLAFNQEALAQLPPQEFFAKWREHLAAFQPDFSVKLSDASLRMIAEAYRPRSKTLADPANMGQFFVAADDAITFDAKAVEKVLGKSDGAGIKALRELREELAGLADWSPPALHAFIEEFSGRTGRGMGNVAQPLRVAVTGTTVSPAIHDTLAILGKDAILKRIDRCLASCG